MEKIVYFDKQGRLYIPEEIRKRFAHKALVLKTFTNGIFIEPIEDDPIEALGRLGKDKLKGKTIQQLRQEARAELEAHVNKKVRRH